MKTQAAPNAIDRTPAPRWMPPHPARSVDVSHWRSRAARGHTWNADANSRPRRTH